MDCITRDFNQGYWDGRNASLHGLDGGQCQWRNGEAAISNGVVNPGDKHFNKVYAFGFEAGWDDTNRKPERMADFQFAQDARELALGYHQMWEMA